MGCPCKLLLTVGQHLPSQHGLSGERQKEVQDGSIGALVCAVLLLSLFISLTVAHWMSLQATVPVSTLLPNTLMCLFMLAGCACVWALTHCLYQRSWPNPNDQATASQTVHSARSFFINRVTFIALCIFLLFGVLFDVFPAFAHMQCMPSFLQCNMAPEMIVKVIVNVLRIIFKFCVVVFAYRYEHRCIENSPVVRYCILSIMLAIVGNWFYLLFPDSFSHIFEKSEQHFENKTENVTCQKHTFYENTT